MSLYKKVDYEMMQLSGRPIPEKRFPLIKPESKGNVDMRKYDRRISQIHYLVKQAL